MPQPISAAHERATIAVFHTSCREVGVRPVIVLQDIRKEIVNERPDFVRQVRDARNSVWAAMRRMGCSPTAIRQVVGLGVAL